MPSNSAARGSLQRQLRTLALLAGLVAVGSGVGGLVVYELVWYRGSLAATTATTADILGSNTAVALAFGSRQDVEDSLSALALDPSVLRACVCSSSGVLVAAYSRVAGEVPACPDATARWGWLAQALKRPVKLKGETVGFISIESDYSAFYARARDYCAIALGLAALSLLIAYFASDRLQKRLSAPLLSLENAARRISAARDYSVRVGPVEASKEIDAVVRAFDGMLEVIQTNERRLARYGEDLEQQVRARTEELRRSVEVAEKATRAKSEFLATMSHEIRTPLNGMLGMTSLLLDSGVSPEQREYIDTIRSSGDALLIILNDLLDFSKIEAGRMELESVPVHFESVLEEAVDLIAAEASRKQLPLQMKISDSIPAMVLGDPGRIRQVVLNLLTNAVKFTTTGHVRLTAVQTASGAIRVEVADTGIGVSPAAQQKLFSAFTQADSSTTRRFGGTGLGLAISRRLVEAMDGRIGMHSNHGVGSTFWFEVCLPLAHQRVPPDPLLLGKTIALRDFPAADARAARRWLEHAGMVVVAPESRPAPDLTISGDSALPGERGLSLAVGAVRRRPLLTSIRRHFAPDKVGQQAGGRLQSARTGRILVAEDNAVNQRLMRLLLQRMGHSVDLAGNGIEAVRAAVSVRYDMILMDCQMPELDGYEAAREIRRSLPPTERPFIVALTANVMSGERERCRESGMQEYLPKPVRTEDLMNLIDTVLAGSGLTETADIAPAAPVSAR